jgi:hypothetical protein
MGLKGDLSSTNLASVFQSLSEGRSTGLLRVQAPEGSRFVEIQDGAISIVSPSVSRVPLGDLLVARGLLADDKLKAALARQRETGRLLGEVLLEMNLIRNPDLEAALRFQIEEEIWELMLLKSGEYDFLANASLDATMALAGGFMRLKIDPAQLLSELSHRAEEWKKVEEHIPTQSMLFDLTEAGQQMLAGGEGLSFEGRTLLELVRQRRSVEAMVQKTCLGRLNANYLLLELLEAELIRPAHLESYLEGARTHLEEGRLEEAERLINYASQAEARGEQRQSLLRLQGELDKRRRVAAGMAAGEAARVRSEVIRRPNPALIIRRRSSWIPHLAALALLVALAAGLAVYWCYFARSARPSGEELKQIEVFVAHVDKLVGEGKYAEALRQLQGGFKGAELKRVAQDTRKKVEFHIKTDLDRVLALLTEASRKNDDAAMQQAIAQLERFQGVNIFEGETRRKHSRARELEQAWKDEKRASEVREQLKALSGLGHVAHLVKLNELLKNHQPERAAVLIRAKLSELAEQQRQAEQLFLRAQACQRAGVLAGARVAYEQARQTAPGSAIAARVQAELAQLDERAARLDRRLRDVEVAWIQGDQAKAREELKKLMRVPLDADGAAKARQLWHRYSPDLAEESAAGELLRVAAELDARRQEAAARQKLLELLDRYPYTLTSERVELAVKITSVPGGAGITIGDRQTNQQTPATVTVPAIGAVKVTLEKPGFAPCELLVYDFREEKLEGRLFRRPFLRPRRMPGDSARGIAGVEDVVAMVGGPELVVADLSRPEVEPLTRITPGEREAGQGALHNPLLRKAGEDWEVLVVSAGARLWRVAIAERSAQDFAISAPAIQAPLPFEQEGTPAGSLVGLVTAEGLDLMDLQQMKPYAAPQKLGASAQQGPRAAAYHDRRFFVACGDDKLHVVPLGKNGGWSADLPPQAVGAPACHASGAVSALGAAGRLVVWDAATGAVRCNRELGGKFGFGPLACEKGFLVLDQQGKLDLLTSDGTKSLWSQALHVNPSLPPVLAGAEHVAVASPGELLLVSTIDGSVLWHGPLDAPPAALAASGRRIYLTTGLADLWVFDTE